MTSFYIVRHSRRYAITGIEPDPDAYVVGPFSSHDDAMAVLFNIESKCATRRAIMAAAGWTAILLAAVWAIDLVAAATAFDARVIR